MKRHRQPNPAGRMLPCLYGYEHDGRALPDLCAPNALLDYNAAGFEHKGDAYYNPWPSPKPNPHKWTMLERGIHITQDLMDIEKLLSEENSSIFISERCAAKLVSIGYTVLLTRIRTIVIRHKTVIQVIRNQQGKSERVIEDTQTSETCGKLTREK